jgi:L,D-transpeptidase YcbB
MCSFYAKPERLKRCGERIVSRLERWIGLFVSVVLLLIMMPAVSVAMPEAEALRKQLEKYLTATPQESGLSALQRFYSDRDYQPVWLQSDATSVLHDIALEFIENAEAEGLDSHDYQLQYLRQLRLDGYSVVPYELEFRTTRALLMLAEDLRLGQLSAEDVDPDWHIPQPLFDPVIFLLEAVASDHFQQSLYDLLPKIPSYQLLKQALAKYRDLVVRQVAWTRIPAFFDIRPNTSHAVIPLVRARIAEAFHTHEIVEYNLPLTQSENYDDDLVNAIKTFQAQHGLIADGIIGGNTRRVLNMTPTEKVQQLRLNMERLRWLPRNLGERYLLVNIAGFQLAAVKHNQQVLNTRIIVGRYYRSTPSFSSNISHLVLNPYWNIPASIARKDLLPKQQKDPTFFSTQGIKVFQGYDYHEASIDPDTIDWLAIKKGFPYVLRQEPGVKNALGAIKFILPNPFSIYLHDTPTKSLFDKNIRTFSSGCIRLENPVALASFVMEGHSTQTELTALINTGKTATVNLPEPLPTYVVYLTTWVDNQRKIHFSPDIYGRDKRVLSLVPW